LGQYIAREYPIDVDPKAVKALEDFKFSIQEYPKNGNLEDRKELFIDVVLAYNDLYNKTGRMQGKEYDMEAIKGLGNTQTQAKYVNMARVLGLFVERGKKITATRPPSKTEESLAAFQAQPLIDAFYTRTEHTEDKSDWGGISKNLQKALFILDLTPEDFIAANDELEDYTIFKYDGKQYRISSSKYEFEQWFKKRAAEKTWTDLNGKKWSLDEWGASNDVNRPFISGAGNKTTKKGQVIAQKKRSFAKKDSESQQKDFKRSIKHFGEALDIIKGGKRVGSWFEMPKAKLKFATLKMTAKQIRKAIDCLSEIKTEKQLNFEEASIYGTIETEDLEEDQVIEDKIPDLEVAAQVVSGKVKKKKFETTQADWNDAYLYFMIGLDVGWRATEGLTATYGKAAFWKRDKDVGEKYQTGVWEEKLGENMPTVMKIKFLTRKTWGMKDKKGLERTTHTELILTPKTRQLLEARVKEIQEGIDAIDSGKMSPEKIFEKYGIKQFKELDGKQIPNFDHTLIGHDGKYVHINSVKFPTKHKLTKAQKAAKLAKNETLRSVKAMPKAQETLHAIMRECLRASGVDLDETDEQGIVIGDYWLTDSLHSIRHVFAQKWLLQSHWNFSFVAKKGHWGASQILEDAYGSVGDKQQLKDNLNAAKFSLEQAEEEENKEFSKVFVDSMKSEDTGQAKGGRIT